MPDNRDHAFAGNIARCAHRAHLVGPTRATTERPDAEHFVEAITDLMHAAASYGFGAAKIASAAITDYRDQTENKVLQFVRPGRSPDQPEPPEAA